jgi:hypothetical protein
MNRFVQTFVTGELRHLERLARVGNHGRRVIAEARGLDRRARVFMDPGAVPLRQPLARNALRRILRVEVEGQPLDAGAEPALQPIGPLEADEAERSDVVAPDGYGEFVHGYQRVLLVSRHGKPRPSAWVWGSPASATELPGLCGSMNVFISDPGSLRDLQDFLRRAHCVAEQCRPNQLEVYVPRASNHGRAQRHVNVYLATWQARNQGVEAYIVEHGNGTGVRIGTVSHAGRFRR